MVKNKVQDRNQDILSVCWTYH